MPQFTDEAVILSRRRFGEHDAILSLLTRGHGRYHGVIKGACGKRLRGALEPGNRVQATWKARLAEHMGGVTCEPVESATAWLLDSRLKLAALQAAAALVEQCLTEREPHPELYDDMTQLLDGMKRDAAWLPLYVRMERDILALAGFGLDLARCAATGTQEGLAYVSPRSGRAVSREAGAPYRGKLLLLPRFLLENPRANPPETPEILDGLRLTGYFLESRVFAPHGWTMPEARQRWMRLMEREAEITPTPTLPLKWEGGVSAAETKDSLPLQGEGQGGGQGEGQKPSYRKRFDYTEKALNQSRQLRQNQTNVEKTLWSKLRNHQLSGYGFRRQQAIGSYIADFVCMEKRLVIELDGGQHAERVQHDRKRDAYLREQGFQVMRLWNNEVTENLNGVLEHIWNALEGLPSRTPTPTLPRKGEGAFLDACSGGEGTKDSLPLQGEGQGGGQSEGRARGENNIEKETA